MDLAELAARPASRDMVFGHYQLPPRDAYNKAQYMALTRRWKYIYSASEHREFLFDLLVDPDETRNRAETLGYLEQTRAMRHALISYLCEEGFTAVLDGDTWRAFPPPRFPEDPDAGLLFQDPAWAKERMYIAGYSEEGAGSVSMNVPW
jgi:hypothetical protein